MNVSLFLKIKSVISVFNGLLMVFLSSYLVGIYGMSLDLAGTVMAQWSGACLTGIGIICWYASGAVKSALRDGILLALFICDSIGCAATVIGQLSGLGNALVWAVAGLWFILALGLGYFRFINTGD